MSWIMETASILNGTFSVMGLTEQIENAALAGETTTDSEPYSIMNAISSASIDVSGITLGACKFNSLTLNYDNQINLAKSIGVDGACATAAFSINVTGDTELFFSDLAVYEAFLDSTSFSVTIMFTDADENVIGLNMPYCKWNSMDVAISGRDAFLTQSGSFTALMDPVQGYTFKLTLIDAV